MGLGCDSTLAIPTLEGEMVASLGDWIIRGVKGELYPCKPDIFAATYEPAASALTAPAAAMREATARFIEQDRRNEVAKECGHEPGWHKHAKELAAGVRALPLPAPEPVGAEAVEDVTDLELEEVVINAVHDAEGRARARYIRHHLTMAALEIVRTSAKPDKHYAYLRSEIEAHGGTAPEGRASSAEAEIERLRGEINEQVRAETVEDVIAIANCMALEAGGTMSDEAHWAVELAARARSIIRRTL